MSGLDRAWVAFRCRCEEEAPLELRPGGTSVTCPACGLEHEPRAASLSGAGLRACLVCEHPELFRAKDFPRKLGFVLVGVAAVLAPFTYYASLFVAAALDAVLYFVCPDKLVCYACHAEHRKFASEPKHPRFDRTIEERLKFGERAVMGSAMREGGTAGAPEPEH